MNDIGGEGFWDFLDQLVSTSSIVIDRPKGSRHPRYPDIAYPLDYGYLAGTETVDGGGVDVWVGSLGVGHPEALILTVELRKRDAEIKILLGCTEAEERMIIRFLNGASMRAFLVTRKPGRPGLELLTSRQSIRRFLSQPVPEEMLERVLDAAVRAPSAHNRQPWRFAVLQTPESRIRLAGAMGEDFRHDLSSDGMSQVEVEAQVRRSYQRIVGAPAAILLCMDLTEMDAYPDPIRRQAEYLMGVQSVAMAGENLLLAAHAQGLGGVWVCAPLFTPGTARSALELPEVWQPQGLLLLGYPERVPEPRTRKELAEVTRYL